MTADVERKAPTLEYQGYCPICEKPATFSAATTWYRDALICQSCPGGSVPRERALALVLYEIRPNWRNLKIHESSAAKRGVSLKLSQATGYVGSQYYPNTPWGETVGDFRNENLEALTFPDNEFDITVTLDVMEHVYNPDKVFQEIHRTLKKGGIYVCTFPVRKWQTEAWERRFEILADGTRKDFKPPEIHGNPVSNEGSIVTVDWGYDLHQKIPEWASFDVRVYRFADQTHGVLGEYTEVILCIKP
jgi:SAM-dependent methyltransferase